VLRVLAFAEVGLVHKILDSRFWKGSNKGFRDFTCSKSTLNKHSFHPCNTFDVSDIELRNENCQRIFIYHKS
jgi:hypothetical protein